MTQIEEEQAGSINELDFWSRKLPLRPDKRLAEAVVSRGWQNR